MLNCGYGHGFSVREVLEAVRRVDRGRVPDRRRGRAGRAIPPVLVADSRAHPRALLGWRPRHDDLDYIVATAWRWEQKLQGMRGSARP